MNAFTVEGLNAKGNAMRICGLATSKLGAVAVAMEIASKPHVVAARIRATKLPQAFTQINVDTSSVVC